jgi:hypothetical protein
MSPTIRPTGVPVRGRLEVPHQRRAAATVITGDDTHLDMMRRRAVTARVREFPINRLVTIHIAVDHRAG